MFTFERMKTALQNAAVMFSNTEQDLIKQTEKSLKKVGVKQYERIVLYFTPALSVIANSIVRNFKVKDNDLMERLRWVVGQTVRIIDLELVPEGKLPLDPTNPLAQSNPLSTTSWLSRLDGIQCKTPDLLLSLTRSTLRASEVLNLPPEKIEKLAWIHKWIQDNCEYNDKVFVGL